MLRCRRQPHVKRRACTGISESTSDIPIAFGIAACGSVPTCTKSRIAMGCGERPAAARMGAEGWRCWILGRVSSSDSPEGGTEASTACRLTRWWCGRDAVGSRPAFQRPSPCPRGGVWFLHFCMPSSGGGEWLELRCFLFLRCWLASLSNRQIGHHIELSSNTLFPKREEQAVEQARPNLCQGASLATCRPRSAMHSVHRHDASGASSNVPQGPPSRGAPNCESERTRVMP